RRSHLQGPRPHRPRSVLLRPAEAVAPARRAGRRPGPRKLRRRRHPGYEPTAHGRCVRAGRRSLLPHAPRLPPGPPHAALNPPRPRMSAGREELSSYTPDGRLVASVRGHNLYVVDVAPQTEKAPTTDGATAIFNGQADWVYGEEIFNRRGQAYWWSPDSKH